MSVCCPAAVAAAAPSPAPRMRPRPRGRSSRRTTRRGWPAGERRAAHLAVVAACWYSVWYVSVVLLCCLALTSPSSIRSPRLALTMSGWLMITGLASLLLSRSRKRGSEQLKRIQPSNQLFSWCPVKWIYRTTPPPSTYMCRSPRWRIRGALQALALIDAHDITQTHRRRQWPLVHSSTSFRSVCKFEIFCTEKHSAAKHTLCVCMSEAAGEGAAGVRGLGIVMVVACVVGMVTTNRKFGHPTFHRGGARTSSHVTSSRGRTSSGGSSGRVFEGLSEFGVLGVVASFLSPADLVGVAAVSTDFFRVSASSVLWRCHCERHFATPPGGKLGEDWLRAKCEEHRKHQELRAKMEEGERGRLPPRHPRGFLPAEQCCRCCGRRHAVGGGSGDLLHDAKRLPQPRRSDCAACLYSWREAFFRAHRAKPQELLRELSPQPPAQPSAQQQPHPPPPLYPCIVVLHGRVHDLTEFLPSHPGGALILREHAYTDATSAFER